MGPLQRHRVHSPERSDPPMRKYQKHQLRHSLNRSFPSPDSSRTQFRDSRRLTGRRALAVPFRFHPSPPARPMPPHPEIQPSQSELSQKNHFNLNPTKVTSPSPAAW